MQSYLIYFILFILLYWALQVLYFFKQIEGKTIHKQKDYALLYCGGLETKTQYLQGIPVVATIVRIIC